MSVIDSYLPFLMAPLRPLKPQYLIFFVTNRCNARCSMCFNPPADATRADRELTIDEIEKIARNLEGLIQLTISGGEPFLRDDFPEIIRAFVRESGVKFITLPTNAFLPEKIIRSTERILEENPSASFNFCISIDDVGKRHDAIRGVKGGFENLLETFREVKKLGNRFDNIEIHTTTVLSSVNASRIGAILEWVDENLKAEVPEVLLVRGSPRDPDTAGVDLSIYEEAARSIDEMSVKNASGEGIKLKLITSLTSYMSEVLVRSERENRMIVPCKAGRKLLILRADGAVDPCEILESLVPMEKRPEGLENFAMGNIREAGYRMEEIMRFEKSEMVRRFIRDTKCHCTFECAIFANIIFGPMQWPRLGVRFLKDWII